jgi:hypothetical protein
MGSDYKVIFNFTYFIIIINHITMLT